MAKPDWLIGVRCFFFDHVMVRFIEQIQLSDDPVTVDGWQFAIKRSTMRCIYCPHTEPGET